MDRHAEFGQPLDSQIPLDPQAPDIDALEIIADWQLDLRKRIKRAELVFELVNTDDVSIDLIFEEVETFRRVCQALEKVSN